MDRLDKLRELETLRERVEVLEAELGPGEPSNWPPRSYYTVYHVLAGCVLGLLAAGASLLLNIIGAALLNLPPLKLIQVYLTFPLGASALQLDSGLALAIGCCLYLLTGMVLGIPFHLVLTRWYPRETFGMRFVVTTVLAIALWLLNFYGILSWLQPLLIGGDWIVREVPWWVAALTHLVFGWTMLLTQPLGRFVVAPNAAEVA